MTGEPDSRIDRWLETDLDEWTRHVLHRHFDPRTGSPYWLRKAGELSFDPRDITRYEQLIEFGPFVLDELRHLDPVELVPLAVGRPVTGRIWESGGTTGSPCRVFYTRDMLMHRGVWRRWSFVTEGFQPGRTWLQATPSGPHLIGNGIWEVSELFAGRVHSIDMDPRWVKRLVRAGDLRGADDYTDHLVDQMVSVLESGTVDYVNTTPALLRALLRRNPEVVAALSGVRLSGTQLTPAMYRSFAAALDGGICGYSYGNTFGNAAGLPTEDEGRVVPYVPNYPQVTMAVVDREDTRRTVEYAEIGQVRLTVLHEDLLLPNILERDQAQRYDPCGRWPSDGVANVRPLQRIRSAPEGIY